MRLSPFIIFILCALALKADERVRWLTPVGDNMVLRRGTMAGEPTVPLLSFSITNASARKVSLTFGGLAFPLKSVGARYEVQNWGKTLPTVPGDLRLRIELRDKQVIEEVWTNVVVGKVFLFGDKTGRGGLTASAPTNHPRADLRVRIADQPQWIVASPEWADPNRNPLPISADAKFAVASMLAVTDVLGLVIIDLDRSPVSSTNGLRRAVDGKVTGIDWFHDARFHSIASFHAARMEWVNLVAREERQGRVVPVRDWIQPEPLQVVIEGNLPPYRIDAAYW